MNLQTRPHLDAGAQDGTIAPRLLTVAQAAAYLGYKSTAVLSGIPVRPLRLSGEGVGTARRYDRKALDRWLDECSGLGEHPTPSTASPTDDAEAELRTWELRREARRA